MEGLGDPENEPEPVHSSVEPTPLVDDQVGGLYLYRVLTLGFWALTWLLISICSFTVTCLKRLQRNNNDKSRLDSSVKSNRVKNIFLFFKL